VIEDLDRFVALLRRGGVLACPTETLVGLLADATSEAAVEAVARIKGRADDAPIAVLLPDVDAVETLAEPLSVEARAIAEAHWPGPLTLVVRAKPGVPARLTRDGTIGMRVPGPSPALELVRAFGGPLTATSANRSGAPAVARTDALPPDLVAELDGVVEGTSPGGPASTILDVTGYAPRVLREGAIPFP